MYFFIAISEFLILVLIKVFAFSCNGHFFSPQKHSRLLFPLLKKQLGLLFPSFSLPPLSHSLSHSLLTTFSKSGRGVSIGMSRTKKPRRLIYKMVKLQRHGLHDSCMPICHLNSHADNLCSRQWKRASNLLKVEDGSQAGLLHGLKPSTLLWTSSSPSSCTNVVNSVANT